MDTKGVSGIKDVRARYRGWCGEQRGRAGGGEGGRGSKWRWSGVEWSGGGGGGGRQRGGVSRWGASADVWPDRKKKKMAGGKEGVRAGTGLAGGCRVRVTG